MPSSAGRRRREREGRARRRRRARLARGADLPRRSPPAVQLDCWRTPRARELIVVGLRAELAHSVPWEACRRVEQGEPLEPGGRYEGFLDDDAVTFIGVAAEARDEHFG